jgi:hypothetical protein
MLESVVECILPLGFASDFEEAPFGAKGTCFLVRRRGAVWVVTAKHAIGEQTGRAMVPHNADSVKWLELGMTSTIDAEDGNEDSAAADLTAIRVPAPPADMASPLDLDALAVSVEATVGDRIFTAGFPASGLLNEVEYSTPIHLHRQRFQLEGVYVGPSGSKHMQTMRFGVLGVVTSLDGMSGSPVFLKHEGFFSFAGVLTRAGSGPFCLAQFIEANLLLRLLDHRVQQGVEAS